MYAIHDTDSQKFGRLPAASGNLATSCGTASLLCAGDLSPFQTGAVAVPHPPRHFSAVSGPRQVLYNHTATLITLGTPRQQHSVQLSHQGIIISAAFSHLPGLPDMQ